MRLTKKVIGRSDAADAPEIDGAVYLNGETNVKPGDIVRVKVENADLIGDLWGSRGLTPPPPARVPDKLSRPDEPAVSSPPPASTLPGWLTLYPSSASRTRRLTG